MRVLVLLIGCLLAFEVTPQQLFTAKAVDGLMLGEKGYAAGLRANGLYLQQSGKSTLITDDVTLAEWRFTTAQRDSTWSVFQPAQPVSKGFDWAGGIGTLLGNSDSVRYFAEGTALFACRMERYGIVAHSLVRDFSERTNLPVLSPAISPDGSQLVFAADFAGGEGGYDLYLINQLPDGDWSDPISLGREVNTSEDELFPSWNGDALYFSSSGHPGMGKLDIYRTTRSSQWKSVDMLEAPFNSPENDFLPLWLSANDLFLTSGRSGVHQVYRLQSAAAGLVEHGMTARLMCAGTPVRDASVSIENALGEEVAEGITSQDGSFAIDRLSLNLRYRARFENVAPEVLAASLLYVYNSEGERVMVIRPGEDGSFWFELLPFDEENALALAENIDESSLLSVSIEGQVFEEAPGDVGKGEPISIIAPNGEVIALAYTKEDGKFTFADLSPDARYTFRLDEESKALQMIIYDEDTEVQVPIDEGRAVFERVAEGEGMELVDESGARITVRKDELFVIKNIYYPLDRYDLNAAARSELDRLSEILVRNPKLRIELGSHTDATGLDDYNQRLSDMRAQVAVEYLESKGIARERMVAQGYGESKLLNHCDDGVECAEEEHALNRRTEIRLIP